MQDPITEAIELLERLREELAPGPLLEADLDELERLLKQIQRERPKSVEVGR